MKKKLKKIIYSYYKPKEFLREDLQIDKINDMNFVHTFFGYYDRSPWSPNLENILYCASNYNDFRLGKKLYIGFFNMKEKSYNIFADTFAWNFQQGAQQQWINDELVIMNDISNGRAMSKIINIYTKKKEASFNFHVGMISTKNNLIVSYNYSRLYRWEIGYGYSEIERTNNFNNEKDGLFLFNLKSGELINFLSYEDILQNHPNKKDLNNRFIWIQHPKFNHTGSKILFVLRSRNDDCGHWNNNVRSDLFVFDILRNKIEPVLLWDKWAKGAHHPIWFSDDYMIINCYLEDFNQIKFVKFKNFYKSYNVLASNSIATGHPTVSNDKKFILTDDYPDRKRLQTIKIISLTSNKEIILAKLYSPIEFSGIFSCDLHPRWSKDMKIICIDSAREGSRSIYLFYTNKLNISSL